MGSKIRAQLLRKTHSNRRSRWHCAKYKYHTTTKPRAARYSYPPADDDAPVPNLTPTSPSSKSGGGGNGSPRPFTIDYLSSMHCSGILWTNVNPMAPG